jgi:hypothetical protein
MATLRCVFGFNAVAGAGLPDVGWTETWYLTGDLPQALATCRQYRDVRKQLLGQGATMASVTVHDIAVKRSALDDVYTAAQGSSSVYTGQTFEHDALQYDLLIRFTSGAGDYSFPFFLAGLPDAVTDRARTRGVEAAFLTSAEMNAFLDYVRTGPFRKRLKDKLNPGQFVLIQPVNFRFRYMSVHKRGRPFPLYRGHR